MAPVGYFFGGEQFAEQPAPSVLTDEAGEGGVVRPPAAVGTAKRRATAVAVAFVVGLGAGEAAYWTSGAAAQGADGQTLTTFSEPLGVRLAQGGEALPQGADPFVGGHDDVRSLIDPVVIRDVIPHVFTDTEALPATPAPEHGIALTDPVAIETLTPTVFTDTPVLPEQPSLPTGADETGWLPPVPPVPGPVVPTFEDTDELVEQPDPTFRVERHTQTLIHEPMAVRFAPSGDVLPTGEAPTAPPAEIHDPLDLTDPTTVEATPTIIFWVHEVLPGAAAPTLFERADDVSPLTNPVAVETVAPTVFTDTPVLPGAVAPTLFEQADDHRSLTDPVVIETTTVRALRADEALPAAVAPTMVERADDPLALTDPVVVTDVVVHAVTADEAFPAQPLGIHDEAGPAELTMVSLAAPVFTGPVVPGGVDLGPLPSTIVTLFPITPKTGPAIDGPMFGKATGGSMFGPPLDGTMFGKPIQE